MSESTAREARRDLRRTVGQGALETLRGQEQSIASVAASSNSLRNDVIALARDIYQLKKDRDILYTDPNIRRLTFWGRLRWLVTGR